MIVGRASLLMKARDMIVDGTIKMIPLMSSSKKKQKPLQKPKTKGMSGLINLTKVEPEESLEDNSTSFSSSLPPSNQKPSGGQQGSHLDNTFSLPDESVSTSSSSPSKSNNNKTTEASAQSKSNQNKKNIEDKLSDDLRMTDTSSDDNGNNEALDNEKKDEGGEASWKKLSRKDVNFSENSTVKQAPIGVDPMIYAFTIDDDKKSRSKVICTLCNSLISRKGFRKHVEVVHWMMKKGTKKAKKDGNKKPRRQKTLSRIKCEICGKGLLSCNMRRHVRDVHEKKYSRCEFCDRIFMYKGSLRIHNCAK